MGKLLSSLATVSLKPSLSQKQDMPPIQEDAQAEFYKNYRKVAEEYDKEFLKKHDEDLNTTLIFVSHPWTCGGLDPIRISGRAVLRRRIRIHHRGGLTASARSKRRDPCAPPDPDLQNRQYHVWKRRPYPPKLDRPSPCDSRCASDPVRKSRHFTVLRLPGDARQTVVESLRFGGHARDRGRAQPEPTAEAGWDHNVVLRQRDGAVATYATGGAAAFRLCAFSVSLGDQQYHCIGSPRRHIVWSPLVPLHRYRWHGVRELSISDAWCPHPPPPHPTSSPFNFRDNFLQISWLYQILQALQRIHQLVGRIIWALAPVLKHN